MFSDLSLQPVYMTGDSNVSTEFYEPVLKQAISFDRTSAYFSARALSTYAEGLCYFGERGNIYRLIISKDISEDDYNEIKKGYSLKKAIVDDLLDSLKETLTCHEERNLSNLAFFIAKGYVEIKFAFKKSGIFHDKCGILTDAAGNIICFRGSNNETYAAINRNYETLQLTCSWLDQDGFYLRGIKKSQEEFDLLWNNKKADIMVLPAEKVIIDEILKYDKGDVIMEDCFLEKNAIILDYVNQLVLHYNTPSLDWLTEKTFYKSRLKYKVEKIEPGKAFFRSDLVYSDFIKIDELLSNRVPPLGVAYFSSKRLKDFIEARNLYIEKRASLGIELKTDATRLQERYLKFKAIVESKMVRKLRDKQMQDAFFMFAMSRSANFSVPGSGKTSSALAVYAFLKANDLVKRIVMIGPKNAFGSWIDEFVACFGQNEKLYYFSIQDPRWKNISERKFVLKYDIEKYNLLLFNYESVENYIDELSHIISNQSLLVFDEVHKVKAIGGQRANAALQVSKNAGFTIAMTGTPIPNSYVDIYNMLHILYRDEYKEFFGFDIPLLKDPLPTEMDIINQRIQPFFCRTTKQELHVPEANKDIISTVTVTDKEQALFDIVSKKYRDNKLALFIRLLQLESNPKMLLETLDLSAFSSILDVTDNIDDIDFVDYSEDVKELIYNIEITTKKQECMNLVERIVNEGKTVIVWCIFIDSIKSIWNELSDRGLKAEYIIGEVELEDRNKIINDFKSGHFQVLITNPHTLAESVSLHTVCHDAIYFEYSYNLVHLLQSKDRIHRLGLPEKQYTQYYFMQDYFRLDDADYSMDNNVYQRLLLKEKLMLDAIDNQELEPVYTPEEDLKIIFKGLL